jgi:hypothetical protein
LELSRFTVNVPFPALGHGPAVTVGVVQRHVDGAMVIGLRPT